MTSPVHSRLDGGLLGRVAVGLALLSCAIVIVRCAWVCDDAFITLRTVRNLLAGDGLTWNPGERVQTFTHPLWLFVLGGGHALTGEPFYATLFASIAASIGALVLLVRMHGPRENGLATALVLVLLATSKSFVDYSTSGLENPLTHVFVVATYGVFWRGPPDRRNLGLIALLGALGACNRADAILLLAPPVLVRFLQVRRAEGLRATLLPVALGALPLVLWSLFALFYFGSPVPNTAYAKLGTGLPLVDYLRYGRDYFRSSFGCDPIGVLVFAVGLVLALRSRVMWPAAAGLLLGALYVLRIGGDYMVGRMLTPLIVLGALVVLRAIAGWRPRRLALGIAALLLVASFLPLCPLRADLDYDKGDVLALGALQPIRGVADERAAYYRHTGLLSPARTPGGISHRWRGTAQRALDDHARRPDAPPVALRNAVGIFGYYVDAELTIIDPPAIADPLLARLPTAPQAKHRIGHMPRALPAGYPESVAFGENRIQDPDLARYYEAVRTISRGELWSRERLGVLLGMWTGRYDEFLERYLERVEAGDAALLAPTKTVVRFVDDLGEIPPGLHRVMPGGTLERVSTERW